MKVPPAISGLVFLLLIAAMPSLLPGLVWQVSALARGGVAAVLLSSSTVVGIVAVVQFARAQTTVDPLRPERAEVLVTTAVFRFSRNPMYLSFVATLLAAAIWLSHPVSFALTVVFAGYLDIFQIRAEESALRARFGERYSKYCERTRRWI